MVTPSSAHLREDSRKEDWMTRLPLHSPVHLAKSLSTLDQLSRGRIEVGRGTGGRERMFSAFEVDPEGAPPLCGGAHSRGSGRHLER